MINQGLKLNFDGNVQKATRDGFGDGIFEAALLDERVMALSADLSESLKLLKFREKFPGRFVELGVAEQNMATVASGLASYGKIPFICSFGIFSPGRNWEQIRTTIAFNNVPVKIVGSHGGLSTARDGGSHQILEDIALMRSIPNMTVVVPSDAEEARKAVIAIAGLPGPAYLRLSRVETPIFTTAETPFEIGRANVLWDSLNPRVVIIASGAPAVWNALSAAKELSDEQFETIVLAVHTIKPLDKIIIEAVRRAGAAVTVEDHQIAGGLGGAVAECLAENCPAPVEFIGVRNRFGQSGSVNELYDHYQLSIRHIKEAARRAAGRK